MAPTDPDVLRYALRKIAMTNHQEIHLPDGFADLNSAWQIMRHFPHFWCVCGGCAIDLFINQISRQHKDVDFAIWRRDQLALQAYLNARSWKLEKANDGQLLTWPEGEFIELPIHTVWCKNPNSQPGFIEILLNEANDQYFLYRRDQLITRLLSEATIRLESGIQILAPEIVLLYKSNELTTEENRSDFETVLPFLTQNGRIWLKESLHRIHPSHEWISRLS